MEVRLREKELSKCQAEGVGCHLVEISQVAQRIPGYQLHYALGQTVGTPPFAFRF